MNGCMATPSNAYAQDPVVWLRSFILAQLNLGLIDARIAEVAMSQVEQLRLAQQMARIGQAGMSPAARAHETVKIAPPPAAANSAFFLWDHFEREGTPLPAEQPAVRRQREEVAKWRERSVEDLLAEMRERKVARQAAA